MREPLDAEAGGVPSVGRRQLVLVDGRTFAISDEAGQMTATTHGLVHDDLRHLSLLHVSIDEAHLEVLAASTPTPLSAVVVARLGPAADSTARAVLTRRRWVASGLREDIHVHNTSAAPQSWTLRVRAGADFAHVFDVKAGLAGTGGTLRRDGRQWRIEATGEAASSRICALPPPTEVDEALGILTWRLDVPARSDSLISLTIEPISDGEAAGLAFPIGTVPSEAIPMRRLESWQESVPRIVSTDPRLALVVDQALADIAALRIIDIAHPDRPVIAAGAPWFMTLFGRDSLLTSWMTLPFDPTLSVGVLCTLAELQGRGYDPVSEEQPGKILHELRRHGGGGPFATRQRYYGTVDATPLFVMLAAECQRWGSLADADRASLAPAVTAAVTWLLSDADSNGDGFVDYQRSDPAGLSNQGWKDSWDGVTFADGSLPAGPIALAEVQGYAYAALLGGAELCSSMGLPFDPAALVSRAEALKARFNEAFWDPKGWFAIGLDGAGRRIDSLTTNPGHALWTGIADERLADEYLDRLADAAMWTGWGLRTLADTMGAYDPLSYHDGSVWPHDTALCVAGAARYGRWDVVDRIVDGAFDAALEFGGRPPELFAGISRAEAPMPVAYPASCSPQAWSSASVLLHLRSMLDLAPSADGESLLVRRDDLSPVPDLVVDRIRIGGAEVCVEIAGGRPAVGVNPGREHS